jgi:hypothetical protein
MTSYNTILNLDTNSTVLLPRKQTTIVISIHVSGDLMPVFQETIIFPKVIPNKKCHINIGPILNGYRAMDKNSGYET